MLKSVSFFLKLIKLKLIAVLGFKRSLFLVQHEIMELAISSKMSLSW